MIVYRAQGTCSVCLESLLKYQPQQPTTLMARISQTRLWCGLPSLMRFEPVSSGNDPETPVNP